VIYGVEERKVSAVCKGEIRYERLRTTVLARLPMPNQQSSGYSLQGATSQLDLSGSCLAARF